MCKVLGAKIISDKLDVQTILDRVQKFAKSENITIQLFNAEYIFGNDHVISACEHAKRAFARGSNISDSLAIEILLYAAGEYQIKNALAKLGIKTETRSIAIVFMGLDGKPESIIRKLLDDLDTAGIKLEQNDEVLAGNRDKLIRFGIPAEEISAVPEERWSELILEKVALLDILK